MDTSSGLERLVGIVASRAISAGGGADGSSHALSSRARAHADAVAALERCCRAEGRGSAGGGGGSGGSAGGGGGGGGSSGGSGAALASTVTAFNVIHVACHHEAARADRSMRVPKTEWEGAALRNSRVACNSLLPLRSPTTSEERYQLGLERHMANLGEVKAAVYTLVMNIFLCVAELTRLLQWYNIQSSMVLWEHKSEICFMLTHRPIVAGAPRAIYGTTLAASSSGRAPSPSPDGPPGEPIRRLRRWSSAQ